MQILNRRLVALGLFAAAGVTASFTAAAQTRPFPTPFPKPPPGTTAPQPTRQAVPPTQVPAPQAQTAPAVTPAPAPATPPPAAPPATAAPTPQPASDRPRGFGLYMGGGAGFSRLEGEEFPDSSRQFDELKDERVSYRGTAGFHLGPMFSLEASYIYFGEYEDTNFTTEVIAYTGAVLLELPISQNLGIYGKGGMMFFEVEKTDNGNNQKFELSDENPFYGLGVRLSLSRSLALRLEYERFEVFEGDIDIAGVNLLFTF